MNSYTLATAILDEINKKCYLACRADHTSPLLKDVTRAVADRITAELLAERGRLEAEIAAGDSIFEHTE